MIPAQIRPGSRAAVAFLLAAARTRLASIQAPPTAAGPPWQHGAIDRTGLPWAVALQALSSHQPDAPLSAHVSRLVGRCDVERATAVHRDTRTARDA